ncbi:uridine kinase family protein [Microbacterium gorillae]|uniref:uridine kinase family protein n=1 Tax=Microbacterium gorillae TaxID=1231063 RepID=UPI000590D976|nr:phosphoglycerate transporter [Microbacterium gorillae]
MTTLTETIDTIERVRTTAGHPIVVGVSGFGGSGKSTLTRKLVERWDGALRLRGDDFLDPTRSHRRSTDWDGVERDRLAREVLRPFRERRPSTFRRFDWSTRSLADPEPVPAGEILIVDLIGLFHPALADDLDLRVWCDVDLDTATARGLARDAALGRDHTALWREVWVPNERDFAAQFDPRGAAEVRYVG